VAKNRWLPVFNHTNENQSKKRRYRPHARRPDRGIIVFPISNQEKDETVWQLYRVTLPLCALPIAFPDRLLLCGRRIILVEATATEHLIILGHTQIAFLTIRTPTAVPPQSAIAT
jgi:DNA-binding LacI/PurR family transcriptional regulator